MKYLLDTNALRDYLMGNPGMVKRLQTLSPQDLALSAITAMELRYGAARRKNKKLTAAVASILDEMVILPFDDEVAHQAGTLKASLESKGISRSLADTQIASTAMTRGLILVSNDRAFKQVKGLKCVDWRS